MNNWNGYCHRCGKESGSHIMSMFNTESICMSCKKEERKRPDYKLAEAKDLREYAGRLRGYGMETQAANVEVVAADLQALRDLPPGVERCLTYWR